MDWLLPVASPLGVVTTLRHWRDIAQSDPVEISQDGTEILSLADAKDHLNLDQDLPDWDNYLNILIPAARRQVEFDTNRQLVKTTLEMVFDQFPLERFITVPRPPFNAIAQVNSVAQFTWFDLLTSVESSVDTSTYFLDTTSQPGRIVLVPGKVWPTGVRWQNGGRLRWSAGYTDPTKVPARYIHGIKLLLGHWFENREAVVSGTTRHSPEEYPQGYEACIGDRLRYLG